MAANHPGLRRSTDTVESHYLEPAARLVSGGRIIPCYGEGGTLKYKDVNTGGLVTEQHFLGVAMAEHMFTWIDMALRDGLELSAIAHDGLFRIAYIQELGSKDKDFAKAFGQGTDLLTALIRVSEAYKPGFVKGAEERLHDPLDPEGALDFWIYSDPGANQLLAQMSHERKVIFEALRRGKTQCSVETNTFAEAYTSLCRCLEAGADF